MKNLLLLSPNIFDTRVQKRLQFFRERTTLKCASFARKHDTTTTDFIYLGQTVDNNYILRLITLIKSLLILYKKRNSLKNTDVIYAINLDQLSLAFFCKLLIINNPKIVYECADVLPIMTNKGIIPSLFRFVERIYLRNTNLLVVTSLGFVEHYFKPIQNFEGQIFLLENKVIKQATNNLSIKKIANRWRIGYLGYLRCQVSFDILIRIAKALPDKVEIHLHGMPSEMLKNNNLDKITHLYPNIFYHGFYTIADLPHIYANIDFNWTLDFSMRSSQWLLPNRIYEGGAYGVPALADALSSTGAWVQKHKCGFVFLPNYSTEIIKLLDTIQYQQYQELYQKVKSCSPTIFMETNDHEILIDTIYSNI